MTRDEITAQIRSALFELFEIEPARVVPEARLAADLEIDSIDAVDLLDRVRRMTGRKVSAEDFRSVQSVSDLVTVIEKLTAP